MPDLGHAPDLAAHLLDVAGQERRWAHTRAVAIRAERLAAAVDPADRELLVAAAWLHDIGYSPRLVRTGLHSLDGACHLETLGFPQRLCALVAHHSGARFEAAERSLVAELDAFPHEDSPVADALAAADLTAGPSGGALTVHQRIAEVLTRYPARSPVHQAIQRARPVLVTQVRRALRRLASAEDQGAPAGEAK